MNVLVIDVGGSHVKLAATNASEPKRFDSHPAMTPEQLVERVREQTSDWEYDVISLGYPGAVDATGPRAEPGNLGTGWVGFDYERAFGKPVRIINDAVMQALGGYDGGRMLFLGLGTGLGSALITEHVVIPLELGCLRYGNGETLAERVGGEGLERLGKAEWSKAVAETVALLREAMSADYILLGGGNAQHIDPLLPNTRRGGNDDAIKGGMRLWEELVEPHDRRPSSGWRVVR
jgi:polyphosphate glucokinase